MVVSVRLWFCQFTTGAAHQVTKWTLVGNEGPVVKLAGANRTPRIADCLFRVLASMPCVSRVRSVVFNLSPPLSRSGRLYNSFVNCWAAGRLRPLRVDKVTKVNPTRNIVECIQAGLPQ